MKSLEITRDLAVIRLSREECRVVMQALNEACERISVRAFHPRTGVDHEYAESLLQQFRVLWEKVRAANEG